MATSTPPYDDTGNVFLLCNNDQNSRICFYNTVPTSEDGEMPVTNEQVGNEFGAPIVTWEGNEWHTVHFLTQINGNAAAQPNNTVVGTGYHLPPFSVTKPGTPPLGYNVYNICRDNGRVVFTDPVLGPTRSIYYCQWTGATVATIPIPDPVPI